MEDKVIIIGAGVCGLAAGRELARRQIPFLILESGNHVGGRLQTDLVEGFRLDHGFQVLNTDYPEFGKQGIDIASLNLRSFAAGARLFRQGKQSLLADPQREKGTWMDAIFSPHVRWSDLFKMKKLRAELGSYTLEQCQTLQSKSTIQFLKSYGFSHAITERFFRPFFGGVFLESELETNAAMFAWAFANFARGSAALPANGMQAVADLLLRDIPPHSLRLNTAVAHVEPGRMLLEGGEELGFSKLIIASGTRPFKGVNRSAWTGNHHTNVLYFRVDKDPGLGRYIGLNSNDSGLIGNFCMPDVVQPGYATAEARGHLLSVSLRPEVQWHQGMESQVTEELGQLFPAGLNVEFIRHYQVNRALPKLTGFQAEPEILNVGEQMWASGDFAGYPSLNSALRAGYLLSERI